VACVKRLGDDCCHGGRICRIAEQVNDRAYRTGREDAAAAEYAQRDVTSMQSDISAARLPTRSKSELVDVRG
jgi:hypothetical protein